MTLIVPAYNEEKVIKRTIQSAIESDYPDLEIIVVDDGSTDDTAKVVGFTLGHDERTHDHPAFKTLLVNAVKWVGGK
mgnify:CR=1 FL=1